MAKLTEDQLAQLKAALQQRYLELREEIRSELERSGNQHYADLAGSVADPGDESVADMLVDVNAAPRGPPGKRDARGGGNAKTPGGAGFRRLHRVWRRNRL